MSSESCESAVHKTQICPNSTERPLDRRLSVFRLFKGLVPIIVAGMSLERLLEGCFSRKMPENFPAGKN
jgi:hypothetical protein